MRAIHWVVIAVLGLIVLAWNIDAADDSGPVVPSKSCIAEMRRKLRATRDDFEQMAVTVCTVEQEMLRRR